MTQSLDDCIYLPTPQKGFKHAIQAAPVPNTICLTNLSQVDKFVQQMNEMWQCSTPGCMGDLVPLSIQTKGLGGAVSIPYACSGCGIQAALFEASPRYELSSQTEIGVAVQVALSLVGACTQRIRTS